MRLFFSISWCALLFLFGGILFAQTPTIVVHRGAPAGSKSMTNGHLSTKYIVTVDDSVFRAVQANIDNRTPAEQKLESSLLTIVNQIAIDSSFAKNAAHKVPLGLPDSLQPQHLFARTDDEDRIFVTVMPSPGFSIANVDSAVLAVQGFYTAAPPPPTGSVPFAEVWVPIRRMIEFASRPEVRGIRRVLDPVTNTGSVESLGVSRLRADISTSLLGATGNGIKVGVMSDDCASGAGKYLDSSIKTGDIDSDFVSLSDPDSVSTEHEGLAMSEIVQDVAPKAQIYFATAEGGHSGFEKNMRALSSAGCKVICDDIQYPDETVFQDGDIALVVDSLCANGGVVYISSAGNQAGSSSYQTYRNMAGTGVMAGKNVCDFTGSDSEYLPIFLDSGWTIELELQWDDPWGNSSNDYNLYLIDPSRTVIAASSTSVQGSSYPWPFEFIEGTVELTGTYYIALERKTISSTDPDSLARTKLTGWPNAPIIAFGSATSSTFGHSCADSCIGAAAIDATGSNYNTIESFSGQGPAYKISFGMGTRTVGLTRQKPDVACFDGVYTTVPHFGPFYGTSASSPHIAGTAALLLSAQPSLTATQARAALRSGTIDEGAFGNDYAFGYGRLDAFKTITQALSGTGKSFALFKTVNSSIPDGTGSLSSTISPSLNANADSVYLSFTVDSHPRWGDLTASLTSPDGTKRTVLTRPPNGAGTSNGFHPNVILGDNASTSLESYNPDSTEVIGFYYPQNTISSSSGFYNKGISGNWTFTISDSVSTDTGSLKNWGIYWKVLPNANESLTLSSKAPYIWSSDNSLKTIAVSETINNGAIPVVKLDTVTANESISNGDIVATTKTNDTSVQLRAKCDGTIGRVYAAQYELTDIGGYDSVFKVYVPVLNRIGHNSASPIVSSGGTSLGLPSVNPLVSGTTTFSYTLSSSGTIDLSIFDLRGKWKKSVDNGSKSSGIHTITWDGKDANGSLLPDGTYIYQLSAGGSFFDGTITLGH